MTLEDDIALLKYQLSESDKRHAALESDFNKLRTRFDAYNSQLEQAKQMLPVMQEKYDELASKYDMRIRGIDAKITEILELTKRNMKATTDWRIKP